MFVTVNEGHVVDDGTGTYKPGDSVELSDKEGKRLIKLGIVRKSKSSEMKTATIEEIRDAISLLDKEDKKLWTQDDLPQLDALKKILKVPVTSAQRKEAMEVIKAAE
jgi:hypothetical protein